MLQLDILEDELDEFDSKTTQYANVSLTCTVSILFIRLIRRFSRHRLENLKDCFPGRITQYCCKLKIKQLVIGMRKKLQNRLGAFVPCRETFLHSIITAC